MRLFLYLDQYKLYSFSSQLFRGLVDHIVNVSETKREREDGPTEREPNATRLVAEIASESSTVAEKRFLHDYAYDRFEDELRFQSALFEVTADATSTDFERSRFVRVSGPAIFADAPRIKDTVSKFNTLIEAFAYVTQSADIRKKLVEAAGDVSGPSDKKAKQLRDALKAVTAKALAEGSRQDDEFLNQLSYLLDFGFRDSLQVQIPFSTTDRQLLFSAVLDRGALRESEHLLLHKYSRLTDRALTVVGVPTQAGGTTAEPFESNDGNIRSAMAGMYSQFSEVEKTFTGRLDGEVIVDPIAIVRSMVAADGTANNPVTRLVNLAPGEALPEALRQALNAVKTEGAPDEHQVTLTTVSVEEFRKLASQDGDLVGLRVVGQASDIDLTVTASTTGPQRLVKFCDLSGLVCKSLRMDNARVETCWFADVRCRLASFAQTVIRRSSFERSEMALDLSCATIFRCSFDHAELSQVVTAPAPNHNGSNTHINDSSFCDATIKGGHLWKTRLTNCSLERCRFVNVSLEGTHFETCSLGDARLDGVALSSATRFVGLSTVKGCRVSYQALIALDQFGGLTIAQRQSMIIKNATAKLRAKFSGFWARVHLLALVLFVTPYATFLGQQYWRAVTIPLRNVERTETILSAFGRYLLTGGTGSGVGLSFGAFVGQLLYNAIRSILLYKTATLELDEKVTGVPPAFELVGFWYWLDRAVTIGFVLNLALVAYHTYHFLQLSIPYWNPALPGAS